MFRVLAALLVGQGALPDDPTPELPPVSDLRAFLLQTDRAEVRAQCSRWQEHRAGLKNLAESYPLHRALISVWDTESAAQWWFWDQLHNAMVYNDEHIRRLALARLRLHLGDQAYYRGLMPARLPRIDYDAIPLPPVPRPARPGNNKPAS